MRKSIEINEGEDKFVNSNSQNSELESLPVEQPSTLDFENVISKFTNKEIKLAMLSLIIHLQTLTKNYGMGPCGVLYGPITKIWYFLVKQFSGAS